MLPIISIYALVNPINDSVFYIGATNDPHHRLIHHVGSRNIECNGITRLRNELIKNIIKQGGKVEMIILDKCDIFFTAFYEQFYIDLFSSWGFDLLQNKKSYYFEWSYFRQLTQKDFYFAYDLYEKIHYKIMNNEPCQMNLTIRFPFLMDFN